MTVESPQQTMTPRGRWLAALAMQPVDRLPFWPKLDGSYPPAQAEPFRSMDLAAIHAFIGSDRHEFVGPVTRPVRTRTSVAYRRGERRRETVFKTPSASLTYVECFDATSDGWHPTEFPVRSVEDVRVMTEWYADQGWRHDPDQQARAEERKRQIGESAVAAGGIGISPLMYCVEHLAGVENTHLMLADHPAEMEALFGAMHASLRRKAELECAHSPADILYMTENTSTTLISVAQYRRYCLAHIGAYAAVARAADRRLVLHMCGHLKALLPDLATLPVAAFEAFTAPPLGNTTLADGRAACPDVCLIGGTHATLWLESAETIIEHVARSLAELPHHRGIVLTSAGVMPPGCPPEKIKAVRDWVAAYPARM